MKLNGNETAIVHEFYQLFRIRKYGLYRAKTAVHDRYFILDHVPRHVYRDGLKRITNKLFICVGKY